MKKLACLIAPLALAASFCAPAAASAATLDPADLTPQPRAAAVLASTSEATLLETYSGTCGDNLTWTLDTTTGVLTISGTGAMTDHASGEGSPWYDYRTSISSVVIQSGVTSISALAFQSCTSLVSVSIPSTVTSVGSQAFDHCESLESVSIPSGVKSIESWTFYGCSALTSINIPTSVTSIGGFAFCNCSSLTSVLIPENVTSIGSDVFHGCTSLATISIPSAVTSIGISVFFNCTSLTSFSVAAGNTVFSSPDGRCLVENGTSLIAYANASGSTYTLPSSITSIGAWAFAGCTSLTSMPVPETVTSIGVEAFGSCDSLRSVSLPSTITSIGNGAFDGIASGSAITCPTQDVANLLVDDTNYQSANTTVLLSTYSGNCGDTAYWSLNADTGALTIYGTGTMADYAAGESAPWFGYRDSIKSVVIQPGITTIGNKVFSDESVFTSVSIPEGVVSIGSQAFANCSSLMSITIPSSVTTIGFFAFGQCTSLTSVDIPSSVKTVGSQAFNGCTNLTSVSIAEGVATLKDGAFARTAIKTIKVPSSVSSIEDSLFADCTSLTSVSLPTTLTSIGETAFYNCKSLTSISIPEGVTSIGKQAFSSCTALKTANLPSTLTSLGSAFDGCTALTSANIPEGITTIEDGTFYNCTSLATLSIPSTITSIGSNAFAYCEALTSVEIPEGVTSLGDGSFHFCSSLKTVTLPSTISSVGQNAFCAGLPSGSVITCATQEVADLFVDGTNYQSANTEVRVVQTGTCGDNMTWTYDPADGSLTINPGGEMYDYSADNPAPWADLSVTSVVISEGVKTVGTHAFSENAEVAKVTIEEPLMTSVGDGAFIGIIDDATITVPTLDDADLLVPDGNVSIMGRIEDGDAERIADYTEYEKTKDPWCTTRGEETATRLCDDGTSEKVTRPYGRPLGHYPSWRLESYPTSSASGLASSDCRRCAKHEEAAVSAFPDVTNQNSWYYTSAYLARATTLISGFSNGTFGAGGRLTRAQTAAILWRFYRPTDASTFVASTLKNTTGMRDVKDGSWYVGAANWAVEKGIINGKLQKDGSRLFDPDGPVTREQLCTILANASEAFGHGESAKTADRSALESMPDASSVSDWAINAVAWGLNNRIISGKKMANGQRIVDPSGQATRAEMAKIIVDALNADLLGAPDQDLS